MPNIVREEPKIRPGLDKDPAAVAAMFDQVAAKYDLLNDLSSLGQVRVWRKAAYNALAPRAGEKILDLAAGTGTSSATFAASGAHVVACDFSPGMIAHGRRLHPEIEFIEGDATNLPFKDDEFDAATISFGLRNVHGTEKALREMARVVRPGGRLLISEFSTPVPPAFARLYHFYLGGPLAKLADLLAPNPEAYRYLADSIIAWPNQEELGELIAQSGWSTVEYRNLSAGIVALHRAVKTA